MGFDKENNAQSERDSNLIIGRNAVSEALRSGRNIDTLLVVRGERNGSVGRIIAECKEKGVVIKEVDKKKLDFMCGQGNHQGVAAYAAVHEYSSVEDIFALAEERGEAPFIILCDELEDPHNLGAIIRTAETAGAHGVIIPKRRNASLTWAVGKASAGAVEYVPVARVGNLASTIDDLKKRGLWVYTADMDGQNWCETDFSGPVALVVGSEGNGVSRLIKEKSDFVVSLPMRGKITSLNASVAAGILMYEVSRQRLGLKAK
ncbi:MAG: 23S rRNA (guanosine(2251)-2'-O)-methyltransferase RlmB [Clostridia bacterium]|nr:23S rRNA (guanosine(2251)-2'-O)-methyltransferase RlmB [Clostridia bacterium]MBQ1996804.1 23S rRNA (guanosine(2251)-2'-O)-methyltransferase RlmB [Clostridia bacterium]MBQ5906205.1 23S rRNA (guanosine(2251)-2'-O)-methyltransferase RlmB [Clostridia bacterium]